MSANTIRKLSVIALLTLAACAPKAYNFSLSTPPPKEPATLLFEDEKIKVEFKMSETSELGVDGITQYRNYEGIGFTLINKTDQMLTVDWNKVSFKDRTGSYGNTVMHKGVKYTDCSGEKPPSTVPPKGKLTDVITPCYGVKLVQDGLKLDWKVGMLPSPSSSPSVEFGVLIPVVFGADSVNYDFTFAALLAQ